MGAGFTYDRVLEMTLPQIKLFLESQDLIERERRAIDLIDGAVSSSTAFGGGDGVKKAIKNLNLD